MNTWILSGVIALGFIFFITFLVKFAIPRSSALQAMTLALMKKVINYFPDDQLKEMITRRIEREKILNDPKLLLKKLKEGNRIYEDQEARYIPKIIEKDGKEQVVIIEEKLPPIKEPKKKAKRVKLDSNNKS